MAQQVVAERAALRKAKESLTICRRDVRKLISAAIEEGAEGDWQSVESIYTSLVSRIPRVPTIADATEILDEMKMLKDEVLNRLEIQDIEENNSGNDAQIERHIQNSNTKSINEFEPSSRKEQGGKAEETVRPNREPLKAFPLGVVLKACPQISDYGPAGAGIGSWRDLMSAAVVVRSMLGVSPSAYQDACEVMGPENAAIAVSCILERANMINSAGAYLRDLTRRAERGEFSLGPMLMALLKVHGQGGLLAS
jgi:replication initiation protein RepC